MLWAGVLACSSEHVGPLPTGDGGSADGGHVGADGSVPADSLSAMAERLGRAHCQRFLECVPQVRDFYADLDGCSDSFSGFWLRVVSITAAARGGMPASIAAAVDSCEASLPRHPCGGDFVIFNDTCRELFAGEAIRGAPCLDGTECSYGLYCSRASGCGRCQPLPNLGEPCVAGRCAPGVGCRGDSCVPIVSQGAVCGFSDLCELGNSCILIGEERMCQPKVNEGEACGAGIGQCALSLQCPDGICRRFEVRDIYEGCTEVNQACRSGLYCSDAGTCAPVPGIGESCSDAPSCEDNLRCLGGSCVALGGQGVACNEDSHCQPGSVCYDGTCRSWFPCGP